MWNFKVRKQRTQKNPRCSKEIRAIENQSRKNSRNSCKPSSSNGFKKVIQNNRVKSGRKPGKEKGHRRSASIVTAKPDETIRVSKIATCSCGCKTIEKEDVARDLITLEIKVHTKQYTWAFIHHSQDAWDKEHLEICLYNGIENYWDFWCFMLKFN